MLSKKEAISSDGAKARVINAAKQDQNQSVEPSFLRYTPCS